jgi:hypothetical protein
MPLATKLRASTAIPAVRERMPTPRKMISVDDACDRLDESRSTFYRETLPLLRSYTLGRARKIDADSVEELIEKRLAANPANPQKPRRGRPRQNPTVAPQADAAAQ